MSNQDIIDLMNENARLKGQLVKKDSALKRIDEIISHLERIMCLPSVKELKEIWSVALAALTDDQGTNK